MRFIEAKVIGRLDDAQRVRQIGRFFHRQPEEIAKVALWVFQYFATECVVHYEE